MSDNQQLEALIQDFLTDQVREKFVKVMEALENVQVYVPAMMPENLPPEIEERAKRGESIPVTTQLEPQPFLLRKQDGMQVLPVFTSKEQIPPEKTSPALMHLPYMACVSLVINNMDKIQEIALNPFTQGLVIDKPPIETAYKRFKQKQQMMEAGINPETAQNQVATEEATGAAEGEQKTVQMKERDFLKLVNSQVATVLLPMFFTEEPQKAMEQFLREKEQFLLEIFGSVFPEDTECPYTEEDFSVLVMNVTEQLQIVRIDLPTLKKPEGAVLRIYLAVRGEELQYFTVVRKEGEKNDIYRIYEDKHQEWKLELEDSGSEITEIMGLVE